MGFTYQTADIVAGTVLVVERIQSQNYQAGLFGWAIYADGDAEFNNVVVRGSLITGPTGTAHIEINGPSAPQGVAFFTGQPDETFPGVIQPDFDASELTVNHSSPLVAGHGGASLILATGRSGADLDRASLSAQNLELIGNIIQMSGPGSTYLLMDTDGSGDYVDVNGPRIFLRDTSISNATGAIMQAGDLLRINQQWFGTATTPLVNAWVDLAGARFGYTKDATGRVQLRGEVISGTAAQITTLPAGFRPTQSMEWIMRAQGGVVLCAVFVSTTGAVSVTANVASAQSGGVRLDSISFPTL